MHIKRKVVYILASILCLFITTNSTVMAVEKNTNVEKDNHDGSQVFVSRSLSGLKVPAVLMEEQIEEQRDMAGEQRSEERLTKVSNVLQKPELPMGCEAASLTSVLNYFSLPVSKTELADQYMEKEELTVRDGVIYGPDPTDVYAGDPYSDSGFYILAPGLTKTANAYLREHNSIYKAKNISSAGEQELTVYIQSGLPVIVWSTMDYGDVIYSQRSWFLSDTGEQYIPYSNLHCRVLVGVDKENFYLNDPLEEELQTVERSRFMTGYEALGKQAVLIAP